MRDWKIHSWWSNKASPRSRFPTIQLPNWELYVTCESNLLWELESWFCLNGTTNMHHFCEFNGWPTCFFPAYWVSDLFHLRTTLIREYKSNCLEEVGLSRALRQSLDPLGKWSKNNCCFSDWWNVHVKIKDFWRITLHHITNFHT